MGFISTTYEEAFRQEIDRIASSEDIQFAKDHFVFVHSYSCKEQRLPQQCIEDGRTTYVKSMHTLKLTRQKAFYCMGKCKASGCYAECLNNLQAQVRELYAPLETTMNEYLLKFAP